MGNESLCGSDTRDFRNSTYIMCGKQPQFRHSTSINIINHVPVVTGPPLNFQKQETFKKVEKSASQFCQANGLDFMYVPLVARIIAYGHNNIFMAYRKLPQHHKEQFLEQIKYADLDFLDSLYHKYILGEKQPRIVTEPPTNKIVDRESISEKQRKIYYETGRKMLDKGQVGFFFLCAGSSSRFLFQQKFMYPLDLKSGKTILQLLLQRLKRNLKVSSVELASVPIIFACNENNRISVQNFISSKKYCGFDSSKIRFLTIPNLPVLNQKGKICLTFEYKILNRPSGTAKCIEEFLSSGLFNWLKKLQINTLNIMGCENLMETPGDPMFLGLHRERKLQIVGKCTDPLFSTEEFNRYSGSKNGKIHLINPQQILNSKMDQKVLESLMQKSPIAMNSFICGLSDLKNMTRDYQNSMFLSLEYIAYKKSDNYFDFEKEKPLVGSSVYIFEKEAGNLMTCSAKCLLYKIPRDQYLPILSKNGSYSMKEACKKLIQLHQSALNFSRATQ